MEATKNKKITDLVGSEGKVLPIVPTEQRNISECGVAAVLSMLKPFINIDMNDIDAWEEKHLYKITAMGLDTVELLRLIQHIADTFPMANGEKLRGEVKVFTDFNAIDEYSRREQKERGDDFPSMTRNIYKSYGHTFSSDFYQHRLTLDEIYKEVEAGNYIIADVGNHWVLVYGILNGENEKVLCIMDPFGGESRLKDIHGKADFYNYMKELNKKYMNPKEIVGFNEKDFGKTNPDEIKYVDRKFDAVSVAITSTQ